jgi:geranylgeranyl pyrophosphate synthase
MHKIDIEYKNTNISKKNYNLKHIDSDFYSNLANKVISDFNHWQSNNKKDFNDFFDGIDKDYITTRKNSLIKKSCSFIDNLLSPFSNNNRLALFYEAKLLLRNAPKSAFYRNFRDYASVNIDENIDKLLPKVLYHNLQEYLKYPTIQNTSDLLFLEKYNLITDIIENPDFINNLLIIFKKRFKIDLTEDLASLDTLSEIHSFLREYLSKLMNVIPEGSLNKSGIGKFFKVIIGVIIFSKENMPKNKQERDKYFLKIFKIGMYWSITYPLFDNILDTNNELNEKELNNISALVKRAINEEDVSEKIPNIPFIQVLHDSLKNLTILLPIKENTFLYNSIKIFYDTHIEETKSKAKHLNELIKRKIIKSALVRIITATISNKTITEEFIINSFYIGLHNQLEDDFQDIAEDKTENVTTIFTDERYNKQSIKYFIEYNMFLIEKYASKELSNSLKDNFYERIKLICENNSRNTFLEIINNYGHGLSSENIDYFKKIAKLHSGINYQLEEYSMIDYLDAKSKDIIKKRKNPDSFYKNFKIKFENELFIKEANNKVVDAMNYSLSGKSKRLRPLLTAIIAEENNISFGKIVPLLKAIEYFHTATLIFDDLPAQDNSEFRRGKKTLHLEYDEYTAHLAGIALISEGYKCLSNLNFNPNIVNEIINYASVTCDYKNMIKGQYADLSSRKQNADVDIEKVAFLKTGLAIEFAIVSPLMLLNKRGKVEDAKLFAKHLGIAFQIRDDIMDFTKGYNETFKTHNLDITNNAKTFISEYGVEDAKKQFFEHIEKSKYHLNLFAKKNSMLHDIYTYLSM